MSLKFTASDFNIERQSTFSQITIDVINQAQIRFDIWLKEQPCYPMYYDENGKEIHLDKDGQFNWHTHTARLVCIEEIKRHIHEPNFLGEGDSMTRWCKCGVEMKCEWKVTK